MAAELLAKKKKKLREENGDFLAIRGEREFVYGEGLNNLTTKFIVPQHAYP